MTDSVHDLDLRPLFRELCFGGYASPASVPADESRQDNSAAVEFLEDPGPHDLSGDQLDVTAFVDGTQTSPILTFRSRRPIHLVHVAAAAVDPLLAPYQAPAQELFLAASQAEAAYLDAVRGDVPLLTVETEDPASMATAIANLVRRRRTRLEHALVQDLVTPGSTWVVDGDLVYRDALRDHRHATFIGVAKTFRTRWLADESVLWRLRFAQRSGVFVIDRDGPAQRFSCYVMIQDCSDQSWTHGLLRLESFSPEPLPAAAVMCVAQRQLSGAPDGRWDRHLAPVRAVEDYLRALRPPVLR